VGAAIVGMVWKLRYGDVADVQLFCFKCMCKCTVSRYSDLVWITLMYMSI
jgi:hypothetical protein